MTGIVDFPALFFVFSFFTLWLAAIVGAFFRKKRPLEAGEHSDFNVIQAATLTLLGLLIGFTFSMATNRYEQRKNYEENEANAIGTEYVRADLLPPADAARVKDLLTSYLNQRMLFYTTRDWQRLGEINGRTAQLQSEMWSVVQVRAVAQPTAITGLATAGMNDVLNSQGNTQAAWWNRIPFEAWVLLVVIAVGCNLLIGYGAHRRSVLLIVVPLAVSVSLFLVADIDSPRGGLIRVRPQNLESLSQSLRPR